ncbi:MAG: Trm112 family protein [bacterium]
MALDEELLEILVCPACREDLIYFEEEEFLLCPDCRLKYSIRSDIPVMLEDEAEEISEEEVENLTSRTKG